MTRCDYNCFSSETLVFYGKSGEYPPKKGNHSLVFSRKRPAAAASRVYRSAAVAAGAALAAALGICGGCVHYQAAPLAPAHSADEFAARRLTDVTLHDKWDRAELLAVALRQNPRLAVAKAEVAAALAREISAAQAPNPDLTLQSEYARHEPHPWLYGVSLDWLLRSPERRRLDREIAGLDTGNARLELMDQAWAVRSALASALSDWQSARRRLDLLLKLSAAQDRLLAVERQRVRAGEDAPSEVLIHEQALIQVEQQQAELRAAEDTAQVAAAKALGLPPQALNDVVVSWPEWGEPPSVGEGTRQQAREQALLSRADLAQAIVGYDAAEAKLQQSIARQYPQFVLSPGYYWDHGIAKFPFDVGFALPLNRNRGEIAEARAGRELAGQRMLALQAGIYSEIAAAERAEQIARASADAAGRQLDAARRRKQTADLSLRLGAADIEDQVGAEILALRAELELLEMRAQLQTSRNHLEDVLRAPLSGPELALVQSMTSLVSGAGL
jgi:CRISPR system Cascade subunit CasA